MLAAVEASADIAGAAIGASDKPVTVLVEFATWCPHCKEELHELDALRAKHPNIRWLGVNYKAHEEYDNRGGAPQVAAFVAATPWLRVVPTDEALYAALGKPKKIPTLWVFDAKHALVAKYDRENGHEMPSATEIDALFTRLGG
ncbi:hypothetical protein BH11MYX2_BH11MYX2_03460 [soil metagenome]